MDLAFTPDGKELVSAGGDYNVSIGGFGWHVPDFVHLRVWDPATGKEHRQLHGHSKPVRSIAFARDGKTLASVGDDNLVVIWDFATGKKLHHWTPAGQSNCVAFLPDGVTLATAGVNPEQAVFLWNAVAGEPIRSLKAPEKGGAGALAVSPDGKMLATGWFGDAEDLLLIWDTDSGRLLHQVRVKSAKPDGIWSLAFSPDGKMLASAHAKIVRLWNPASGEQLRLIELNGGQIKRLCFSTDGKLLGTAAANGVVLWDPATGKATRRFETPDGCESTAIAFSPDSKTLALNCLQAIRLFDVATGEERLPLGGHRRPVAGVSFSPDGRTIATAGDRPRLWDAATGKERLLSGTASRIACVGFSPNGKKLVAGSHDQNITIWDLESDRKSGQFTGQTGNVDHVAFLPDGKTVISMSDRRHDPDAKRMEPEARIWDVEAGKQVRAIGPTSFARAALSADGRLIASFDEVVPIWDIPTGKRRGLVRDVNWPRALALSPDGRYLAAVSLNQPARRTELTVRETVSGQKLYQFEENPTVPTNLVLALTDRLLASGGLDGSIRLLNLETGETVHRLAGHRGAVISLAFSPDGRRLVSGGRDTTALVWDLGKIVPSDVKAELKAEQLHELWIDLAGDAPGAIRAIRQLARAPEQSVALLRDQFRMAVAPEQEQIAKLIANLDKEEFAVREKASRELAGLGKKAEPALRKALQNDPSVEARRRIQKLLPNLAGDARPPSEVLRVLRAIEVLERIGTDETRQMIERLAKDSSDSWTPAEAKAALERIARQEKKPC
jgi:WD40 repeat protein